MTTKTRCCVLQRHWTARVVWEQGSSRGNTAAAIEASGARFGCDFDVSGVPGTGVGTGAGAGAGIGSESESESSGHSTAADHGHEH